MNAEEQLRKSRETVQVTQKSQIKNKIISLVMLAIAAAFAIYGYKQQQEAKAQRKVVLGLHREVKRLTEESEAVRIEAAKLRNALERERQQTEAKLLEFQKTRKK